MTSGADEAPGFGDAGKRQQTQAKIRESASNGSARVVSDLGRHLAGGPAAVD